jgi:hypothetical protein
MDSNDKVYVGIPAGSVEYSKDEAAVPIEDLIAQLQELKDDGATHVVGYSGNYRGAQFVKLGTPDWDDEEF